jgi:hypothetical protein
MTTTVKSETKKATSVKKVKEKTANPADKDQSTICLPDRDCKISELAYYKAESRGFVPGKELEDWLEAEREFLL